MSTHFIIVDAALEDDPPLDPGIPPTTLAELPITIARVGPSPENGLFAVSGADVFVQKADGTAVSIWADPTGLVPLVSPLPAINGRVTGWVARGQHLRARPVLPGNIAAATDWEYFWSSGVPGAAGAAGAAGPAGAPGPPGGPVAPTLILADAYLALVPGTYANNTLAIEAAMAATPTYGGTVLLAGGIIDLVGELTYPAKPIKLRGGGEDATYLRWLTDTGVGTFAVAMRDNLRHELEDLTVQGPTAAVLNGANANMDGIRCYGRNRVNRVRVENFRAGIGVAGDHNSISHARFSGCRDNIRYLGQAATGLATWGQNSMSDVDLSGATRAGIALAPDGHANGATWKDLHFGMSPVGILYEVDGSNNAAQVEQITQVGCQYENCGNALIYSMSTTQAGIYSGTMVGCNMTAVFRAGFVSTSLLRNQRAHIDGLASVSLGCQDSDLFAIGAGPVPSYVQYGGYQSISMDEGASSTLSTLIAQSARLLANPTAYQLAHFQFRERTYGRIAESHYCDGAGVTAGRLVYRSADGGVKPWVAGKAVYGVALQTGASLDFILVGRKGIWPVDNSVTSALAIGDAVIPDAVTANGRVTVAGAAPGASIGTAVATIAANATGRVDFMPSGWRY